MKIHIYFIMSILLLVPSLEQEYYEVSDVSQYLDSQGLEDYEYQEILSNLDIIFKNSYAFYDIAKNPPQPYFDNNYHSTVNIGERFKEIDTTDINFYEFYRRVTDALSGLRDPHIIFSFTKWEFPEFLVISPLDYIIDADFDSNPKIFATCLEEDIIKLFEDGINIIDKCLEISDSPVKSINGQDPFEYITNFGGNFISSKNNHSTFTMKINNHNYIPLTECTFDLSDENLWNLEVVFDNELETTITTKYMLYSEIDIREDENFLRALSHGRGFYTRSFYQNLKNKKSKKFFNIKEEIKKRRNKKREEKKLNKNKTKLRELSSISWSYSDEGEEIFKCQIEEEQEINYYYVSSFAPQDRQRFIETIEKCVKLFDENNYPIVVINELNSGGYTYLSQLFMGILSPLMPINLFKGRLRMTEAINEKEEIIEYINSNLTNVNTCKNMSFEDLFQGQVSVNYSDIKLSEIFYINNASVHNKIEELRLNMTNKRKPTEILILTDGYSFSAAGLYIKYLQKMGGAIVVGYYGNPYGFEEFDSSQSPSAVFNSHILSIFNPEEIRILEQDYTFEIQIPGIQTFFDVDDKNVPLEYDVTPVDYRLDIYKYFDEENIDQYEEFAKSIFDKFQETSCDKNNKKLIKVTEECDGSFLNKYTHGGYACDNNGTWSNICIPLYCDRGYIFDKNQNKCIKDICSSIFTPDEEEEEQKEEEEKEGEKEEETHKEEENKEDEKEEENKEEETNKEEENKEDEKKEEETNKEEEDKEEEEEKEEQNKEEETHKEEEIREEEEKNKEEDTHKEEEIKEEEKENEKNKDEEEKIDEEEEGNKDDGDNSSDSDKVYIIIFSVIGGIIFIAVIILIIHCCKKRNSNEIDELDKEIDKIDNQLIDK